MTIDAAIDQFTRYIASVRRLSPATQRAYASDLRQFREFTVTHLEDRPVEQITTQDIEDFVASCAGLSKRTVRRRLSTLSSFWRFLAGRGHVQDTPVDAVPRPREPRDEPAWVREDDLQALLSVIDDPTERAIFFTLASAALRRAEVLHLDVSDVDREAGHLRVRGGKGDKDRTVPISEELADALRDHLRVRGDGPSDALFTSSVGTRLNSTSLQRMFSRWLAAAGLEDRGYSPHALRHAAATRWIRAGLNVRDVQQLLGHEDVGTTSRYLHASPDRVRREMVQKVPAIGQAAAVPSDDSVELTPEMAHGLALLGRLARTARLENAQRDTDQ